MAAVADHHADRFAQVTGHVRGLAGTDLTRRLGDDRAETDRLDREYAVAALLAHYEMTRGPYRTVSLDSALTILCAGGAAVAAAERSVIGQVTAHAIDPDSPVCEELVSQHGIAGVLEPSTVHSWMACTAERRAAAVAAGLATRDALLDTAARASAVPFQVAILEGRSVASSLQAVMLERRGLITLGPGGIPAGLTPDGQDVLARLRRTAPASSVSCDCG